MKSDNAHRAANLVSAIQSLDHAIRRLQQEDVGERVLTKMVHSLGRTMADVTMPPTYLVKALQDYRESIVIEAEAIGVVFDE